MVLPAPDSSEEVHIHQVLQKDIRDAVWVVN
jgi:hypothetical protein